MLKKKSEGELELWQKFELKKNILLLNSVLEQAEDSLISESQLGIGTKICPYRFKSLEKCNKTSIHCHFLSADVMGCLHDHYSPTRASLGDSENFHLK